MFHYYFNTSRWRVAMHFFQILRRSLKIHNFSGNFMYAEQKSQAVHVSLVLKCAVLLYQTSLRWRSSETANTIGRHHDTV